MASQKYIEIRNCKAIKSNGEQCKAWAVWGENCCYAHGGRANGRQGAVCSCVAYAWPHRLAITHKYLSSNVTTYSPFLSRLGYASSIPLLGASSLPYS